MNRKWQKSDQKVTKKWPEIDPESEQKRTKKGPNSDKKVAKKRPKGGQKKTRNWPKNDQKLTKNWPRNKTIAQISLDIATYPKSGHHFCAAIKNPGQQWQMDICTVQMGCWSVFVWKMSGRAQGSLMRVDAPRALRSVSAAPNFLVGNVSSVGFHV